jgi:hypothetical protein
MIGLGLIVVIAIVGAIRKPRGPRYWILCAAAAAYFAFLGPLLFYAGGTLDNPAGDGVITRAVRVASSDGPFMGLWAIAVLLAVYGGTIWFLVSAYRAPLRQLPRVSAPEVAPPVAPIKAGEPPRALEEIRQEAIRRKRSLSGWARLWIVIALAFWAWMAFQGFQWATQEPCASIFGETIPPPGVITPYQACEEAIRRGLIERDAVVWRRTLEFGAFFAGYAVALWLIAMTAKSLALWIWRGFRPDVRQGTN